MKQNSLQNWPGLRIVLSESQSSINAVRGNLFWVKNGYVHYFANNLHGEKSARAVHLLQQWLPVKEISADQNKFWLEQLRGAEECFYVDPEKCLIRSVFQRKSVKNLMVYWWQNWFGINWKIKYAEFWPALPVRQIDSLQIGNSRVWMRKLRDEYKS